MDNVTADWLKNAAIFFGGAAATAYYVREFFRKPEKKIETKIEPQPLIVELRKTLHEEFASRKAFEDHVEHNTSRHGQLFNKIDAVERQARVELDRRMAELSEDRRRTLEKLNDRNERIMFALGKIAAAQGIEIEPTE